MQMIDRDIAKSSALVIDANPTSRGMLVSQLRDFGVGQVMQASKIHDARRMLESRPFDIVMCEQDFEAEGYSGQNLLDDLRRLQLLPLSTAFVIVTGTASTTTVVDAAESAVDTYLVKPYTAAAMRERLMQVRKRKMALADIFAPVESGDFAAAARLCLKRFKERAPFHAYAARLGCELLLRIGEPEAARKLNELVLEGNPNVPWARLGIARAQIDSGQTGAAVRTLEALVAEQPNYTDAFDVLGRLQVEQGDLTSAISTYQRAAEFTRGSIERLQRHGLVAFHAGEREEALKPLERAALLGQESRMFDPGVLVALASLRYELRDSRGLQRALDTLSDAAERDPGDERLARLSRCAALYGLSYHKQQAAVEAGLKAAFKSVEHPTFDAEAACYLLSLCATFAAGGQALPAGVDEGIDLLAQRFASSRAMTELLAGVAGVHLPLSVRVRQAQAAVATMAEQAVTQTLKGNPTLAVRALLQQARHTRNAKLIELARMTLSRHAERIDDAQALNHEVDLLRAVAAAGAVPPLGSGSTRASGALATRGAPSQVGAA